MRPQFIISILFVVLLILALLFWRRPSPPPNGVNQPQVTIQANTSTTSVNVANQNIPGAAHSTVSTNPNLPPANKISLSQAIDQEIEMRNKVIDFYGEVIDQDSNTLSGVDIKATIRHWTLMSPAVVEFGLGSTDIHLETTTGPDGRFELSGATGDGGGIRLTKDGYEAESEKNGFGAGIYSYANPIIFKMWKTNIHEKLITGKYAFHIVPDGRPYFINLTGGTISESGPGDLRVWVKRPEQIVYGTRYDWSSEVDVINGGLQSASDYAMWMAPSDGYVPSFQFEQAIGNGWGDSTGERRFYITLNNGHEYGHISVELYAYYNNQIPGLIRLTYAINPSGSRILR